MPDNLATIRKVIEEHQVIRRHLKLVGDTVSDREAVSNLEESRIDWIPGRPQSLVEIRENLQQALSSLDEGLKNHFAFEEKNLPSLLGELFMKSIRLDHQEIRKALQQTKTMSTDTRLMGLSRDELMHKEAETQQTISNLIQLIEDHAAKEETLLEMLLRVLEKER
jgi:hemerythrin